MPVMAVLAGAGSPIAIAGWANDKKDLVPTLLPLPNGILQKDVYRRGRRKSCHVGIVRLMDARTFHGIARGDFLKKGGRVSRSEA